MSLPADFKIVNRFTFYMLWSCLLVFFIFVLIDFFFFGWHNPGVYFADVHRLLWTALFAFMYTIIYNHAASWRPLGQGAQRGADGKILTGPDGKLLRGKFSGHKILNSILFSLAVSAMIIAAISLCSCMISLVFIYFLEAFHGGTVTGDVAVATQAVVGGLALELCGKEETAERRNG
jgi:hypothetical protein